MTSEKFIVVGQGKRRIRLFKSVKKKPVKIVVMGQSLASGLSISFENESSGGMDALERAFCARSGDKVETYNVALPSTSLLSRYRPRRSWWNEAKNTPGRLLADAIAKHPLADVVLWSQGENDALDPALDIPVYKLALKNLFQHLHDVYGCVIVCNFIGRRIGGNDEVTQAVHQVQRDLVASMDFVFAGAEQYHVALFDQVHPDDTGFVAIGAQSGAAAADARKGISTPYPFVTQITSQADTVTFKLGGSDRWAAGAKRLKGMCNLTPTNGESQFLVVGSKAGKLTPHLVSLDCDKSQVTLEFDKGAIKSDDALFGYVGYGAGSDMDLSTLLTDISPLKRPIRRVRLPIKLATPTP